MNNAYTPSRRQFLKLASTAVGAAAIVPARALGKDAAAAPSQRITLGFIGVGMMGRGHLHWMAKYPKTQILAVCDVDTWRRDDAKRFVEDTYSAARPGGTYKGCTAYNDLRELVARSDIDAVVVATGDRWHALASILAAESGKDVYCEKPMSNSIRESRAMVDAVRRYGRVFQTGLQQRSTPEFIKAAALTRAGRIGKIRYVYVGFPGTSELVNLPAEPTPKGLDWDLWLGPAPWRPFNGQFHHTGEPKFVVPWHICRDFGGGNLTSNAVHAFDVVQWGLDMDESGPVEIVPPETGRVPSLTYKYASGAILQVEWKLDPAKHYVPKGWDPKTQIEYFGALYVGADGWIHVGRNGFLKASSPEILREPPAKADPEKPVGNHHQNWLDCIRSRAVTACDVAVGARSTSVAHLGCIAHWTGRALRWDPASEEFLDDAQANHMRGYPMRAPWRL
jgi:hypothetical protein